MKSLTLILLIFQFYPIFAQNHLQTVRGTIQDKESLVPLIGANILIENTDPMLGTSTDDLGNFTIDNVPVGRCNVRVSYLGYEPLLINNILVTSGKEVVLDLKLSEALTSLKEIVVSADQEKATPLNEMAFSSARSFSVEETSRYASSLFDPARMAMNFAGVSTTGGSSDLFNEIIVRGNSPRGVIWRMEGIEIPNPNHFGGLGNSGGGISMLSSSTISTSDFYTGAFPAEFGNATAGAFDINLRKGNSQKREHAIMLGILGTEIASEGPMGQQGDASYLFNFRYSTLGVLKLIGLNPVGDVLPEYGDLSFNVYLPKSSFGTINIFGLVGKNRAFFTPEPDSSLWEEVDDDYGFNEKQTVGTIGISHRILLGNDRYLHTVFAASLDDNSNDDYILDPENNYRRKKEFENNFSNKIFRVTSTYHRKVNAKTSYKIGGILSYHTFDFFARNYFDDTYETFLQDTGSAGQMQGFVQWKHRLNTRWTATLGLHATYFALTEKGSLEPRMAVRYTPNSNQAYTLSLGMHSKPEHPVFYYNETTASDGARLLPNRNLDYIKALHLVLGYDKQFSKDLRLKIEGYYQHLYDVAVEENPQSKESLINVLDVWDILGAEKAVAEGLGKNYGIDVSFEKNFTRSYYALITGSIFNSQFRAINDKWYNTRFNSNYQLNILAGREFVVGRKKNKILALNGKIVQNGGNRATPINLSASRQKGETIYLNDQFLEERLGKYFRYDAGISYKVNRAKMTHTIMLDVQNITNRLNPLWREFSVGLNDIDIVTHAGLFPVLNYRIEF